MSFVLIDKLIQQFDVSSGKTEVALHLIRSDGMTYLLPCDVLLDDSGFMELLGFLVGAPNVPMVDENVQNINETPNGEEEYERPPERDNFDIPNLSNAHPGYNPGYSVEGEDFEGGGGIDQL